MTSENPSPFTSPAVPTEKPNCALADVALGGPRGCGREASGRAQVEEGPPFIRLPVVIQPSADDDIREAVPIHVPRRPHRPAELRIVPDCFPQSRWARSKGLRPTLDRRMPTLQSPGRCRGRHRRSRRNIHRRSRHRPSPPRSQTEHDADPTPRSRRRSLTIPPPSRGRRTPGPRPLRRCRTDRRRQ